MAAPLFLIGFMASGKTSVGRTIAEATGRRFVDLDDEIAAMGEPAEMLVARDEPEFRRREAAALRALVDDAGDAGLVIATGGGAAASGDNLARMRAAGLVVALGVDAAESERRATAQGTLRPLMAHGAWLLRVREPIYRRAHALVDTMGRTIEEVAREVQAVEAAWARLPTSHRGAATMVPLGARSYPVVIGEALGDARSARDPDRAGITAELLRGATAGASSVAVITDENVARHHLQAALDVLGLAPDDAICVAPGEASKSVTSYEQVSAQLVARGLDRGSVIVALGGGVVGDLAGFIAATLYRGIPVIQVPTTLIAMTDAAIGGKTALDLPAGKNLLGAFWQPRLVACATATLGTLPERERRAGFGELWKYALLDGLDLWKLVGKCTIWAGDPGERPPPIDLVRVIERAVAYKAAIVGRDEREQTGARSLLNLGHTIGHAIEAVSGMLHGEAVGLGLLAACRVSHALVNTPPDLERELHQMLAVTRLPTNLDQWLTDPVLERVRVDKKRQGDTLRFIAVKDIGSCDPVEVSLTELTRILRPVPGG